MLAFGVPHAAPEMAALSVQDADDIHAYVIDRAWAAYRNQAAGTAH
jgi:hypothetical protein